MPSSGTRWKAAFLLFVALVGAWMVWSTLSRADAELGEDIAQRELTDAAQSIREGCAKDPAEVRRLLGSDACAKAKEITERPTAEKGDPGEPGARGPAGPQGEAGPRGPAGPVGPAGPSGPRGIAGADGSSPACLLTANACTGPVGPVGPRGATGETGQTGAKGEPGERGATGEQGEKGDQGEQGATGERGAQGEPGVDGRGIQGVTCDSQTPITFTWTWTDGTVGTATCGGTTPPPNARR